MSSIILEAKSLTKEYKQTLALDHINLQIKKTIKSLDLFWIYQNKICKIIWIKMVLNIL